MKLNPTSEEYIDEKTGFCRYCGEHFTNNERCICPCHQSLNTTFSTSKNEPSWKKLSGMELLVFAAEVKLSGDEKFLEEITDFIKEKDLSPTSKNY